VAINETRRQSPRRTHVLYDAIRTDTEVVNRLRYRELLYLVRCVHGCDHEIYAI
jgi:hypothetical protein